MESAQPPDGQDLHVMFAPDVFGTVDVTVDHLDGPVAGADAAAAALATVERLHVAQLGGVVLSDAAAVVAGTDDAHRVDATVIYRSGFVARTWVLTARSGTRVAVVRVFMHVDGAEPYAPVVDDLLASFVLDG